MFTKLTRATDGGGDIWVNLTIVQTIRRLSAERGRPERTCLQFATRPDGLADAAYVSETPEQIMGLVGKSDKDLPA